VYVKAVSHCSAVLQKFDFLQVIHCIEQGLPLLIENLPEEIDPVMDAVIGKRTIKRGKAQILRLGDTEVEYNPNFR
jgi:dynein heavy chain